MRSDSASHVGDTVRRTSLSGQVARLLGQYLEDNRLGPGDPLPAAKELAERFGVSIPVVREAIAELAGQGRLHRSQGRPTIARAPSPAELQAIFRSAVPQTERDRQLLCFRRTLQVGAVRAATQHAEPTAIAQLRDQLADWEGLPPLPEQLRHASVRFHHTIGELTGNDLMLLSLDAADAMLVDSDIAAWRGRLHGPDPVVGITDELAAVVAAMLAAKPRRAERLLHDHLDHQDHLLATT